MTLEETILYYDCKIVFILKLIKCVGYKNHFAHNLHCNNSFVRPYFSHFIFVTHGKNSYVKLAGNRAGINSWTNLNFGQIGTFPSELGTLECLKFPVAKLAYSFFIRSLSNLLVTGTSITSQTSSNYSRIRSVTLEFRAHECQEISYILLLSNMKISNTRVGQYWSKFMSSINGIEERLHYVLGQIGSQLWLSWQPKTPVDLL